MKKRKILLILITLLAFTINKSHAQTVIRDAEIETTLKTWLAPLLQSAGMGKNSVNIILIQDPQLNAFVAGGNNIFIYTGLIEKTKNPGELIGVMAHELGHITGGHLIASNQSMKNASYESIIGTIIGVGIGALGGGDAGSAVAAGANSYAQSKFLSQRRVQESSADQAALKFMDRAGLNPTGIVTFMETLEGEELLPSSQQSEYVRTHPLTTNRIDAIRRNAEDSRYSDLPLPAGWDEDHARMRAKLIGFINPSATEWHYSVKDDSFAAIYARSIASFRQNNAPKALELLEVLLQREPNNPYLHELKGQILLDYGRIDEAITAYTIAENSAPAPALMQIELGKALLQKEDQPSLQKAIRVLEQAANAEKRSPQVHRLLATAYGKTGDEVKGRLHLAEEAALKNNFSSAKTQANFVIKNTKPTDPAHIRAQDIIAYADIMENKKKK